jgi:small conductance mechanosensitive channel
VGEYTELLGVHGQVKSIDLFSTVLTHPDQSRVVIPNRKVIGEILHNCGHTRQLDLSVGVAYSANLGDALATVRGVLAANPRVLKLPEPVVGVSVLAGSSVVIGIKPWAKVDDFVPAGAELNQAILEQFRTKGIEIPFPRREVLVLNSAELAGRAA